MKSSQGKQPPANPSPGLSEQHIYNNPLPEDAYFEPLPARTGKNDADSASPSDVDLPASTNSPPRWIHEPEIVPAHEPNLFECPGTGQGDVTKEHKTLDNTTTMEREAEFRKPGAVAIAGIRTVEHEDLDSPRFGASNYPSAVSTSWRTITDESCIITPPACVTAYPVGEVVTSIGSQPFSGTRGEGHRLSCCFADGQFKRSYIFFLVAVTTAIIAMVIVLTLLLPSHPTSQSTPQPMPTPQSVGIQSSRNQSIRKVLAQFSSAESLSTANSPQNRSADWILSDANSNLDPTENEFRVTQRYALAVLYFSTDGEHWKHRENFLSLDHECKWSSDGLLSCNSATGEVIGLYLGDNLLRGTVPSEIQLLSGLQELHLQDNSLVDILPSEVGSLSSLLTLYLRNNLLNGPIPTHLCNISTLNALNLGSNGFTGTIPSEVMHLTHLHSLNFSVNELTGSIPGEIGAVSRLETINLQYNQLIGRLPKEVGYLSHLSDLEVDYNALTGPLPLELGYLSSLETLTVACNSLTGTAPLDIFHLENLATLILWNNSFTGTIPHDIQYLQKLYYLDLSVNQLTGSIPTEILLVQGLAALFLNNNELSGSIPTAVGTLSSLVEFDLESNHLIGTIPSSIGNLTALQELSFGYNMLTGTLPTEIGNLKSLTLLIASNNNLSGTVPTQVLASLPKLSILYLWGNHLVGNVSFLCQANHVITIQVDFREVECSCCEFYYG